MNDFTLWKATRTEEGQETIDAGYL